MNTVKCSDQFKEVLAHSADRDFFLQGTNITFMCQSGKILIGHDESTCTDNGQWEPNPNRIECKGKNRSIIIFFL